MVVQEFVGSYDQNSTCSTPITCLVPGTLPTITLSTSGSGLRHERHAHYPRCLQEYERLRAAAAILGATAWMMPICALGPVIDSRNGPISGAPDAC